MESLKSYTKVFTTQKGREVLFRPLREGESVDALLRFINDLADEDTFVTVTRRFTREEEDVWLSRRLGAIGEGKALTLLALSGERVIASVGVDRKGSRSEHVGEMGIAISPDFRDEGIGSALLRELIALAKNSMGLKILVLRVFGPNELFHH